ncbi:MAG: tannase/feruloyl esterase family alpha/beta hydrolase [Variovorax sp.]|nr:tannase/feruloyl esterase family alpha/beta hydrolase [Variovorax sp.]
MPLHHRANALSLLGGFSLAFLSACGGGGGSSGFAALPSASTSPSGGGATAASANSEIGSSTDASDNVGTGAPTVAACGSLAGMSIAANQIGLPSGSASVVSATAVAAGDAGNSLGSYCKVRGTIQPLDSSAPVINFAVNLPDTWNTKAIHFGGGGFDGVLIDGTEPVRFGPPGQQAPLAMGYATYGDDAGHQSGSITDGTFAMNDESLGNYGGNALKKTHDIAFLLIKARYGRLPGKAYFLGTSTGGRDALLHIQRWPNDYDGVIANEPALNYSGTRLSNIAVGRALYNNGAAGWLNLTKTLLVQKTVKDACDKLDGVLDNIVSNVESCRQLNAYILASLRCPGGIDTGNTCLSDAQLATVQTIESPLTFSTYALANGVAVAGGYNLLEGAQVAGPYTTRDLGTRPVPGNPATTADANMYVTGDQWAKYFVTRVPTLDTLTFDPLNPGSYTARVQQVSAMTDATNPDLSPFLAHGGKLILLHGLADEVISNNSTINYYKQVVSALGQSTVDKGIRFYTVPGMGHGTGVFIPAWDSLSALDNWVQNGLAPATGVAMDTVAGTYGRTRPLCLFPAWPKFNGSGSADAAINYSCVQEAGDPLACANLPTSATTYKGGDALGEELSFTLNPSTLAYTVTVDASLQRTAGTQRSGTLVAGGNCTYTSSENGASFTFGAGGAVQGGVSAPTGSGFVPLLVFQNTFNNASSPAVFNPVANIFNVVGVQYAANGSATAYGAASRVRNAGTFQHCQDPTSGSFMVYDAACTSTAKGYLSYNQSRNAFDVFTTSPTGSAVTTGGTLSGSAIFGQVGAVTVPLFLVRESASSYGMRVFAPQTTLASGTADGQFAVADNTGQTSAAVVNATSLSLGSSVDTLTYDTPVLGVAQGSGAAPGNFIFSGGLLGFISASGNTGAALQLGLRH